MDLRNIRTSIISAITLDYWDTLVRDGDENHVRRKARRKDLIRDLVHSIDHSISELDIVRAIESASIRAHGAWLEQHAPMPALERLRVTCAQLGLQAAELTLRTVAHKIERAYADCPAPFFEGATETVRQLRDVWPLGIISDTGQTPGIFLATQLYDAGILACFRSALFSDECSVTKPNPRIFEAACASLSRHPEQVLHVGDNPITDIKGALQIGMQAIQIAPEPDPAWRDTPGYGQIASINDLRLLLRVRDQV